MSCEEFHVAPPWRELLAGAGLDRFDALMALVTPECFSWHRRGQTYRVSLSGGRAAFVKRDSYTLLKQVLGDLLRLRRPQPMTWKERSAMQRVAGLGIRTAEIIAWGQRRRWGLAWQGVLVTGILAGQPLDDYLQTLPPVDRRTQVLADVGSMLGKLYAAGLTWPDLVARHVFVQEGLPPGLLDLERLRHAKWRLHRYMPRQVVRFCQDCRRAGAAPQDIQTLLDAMARTGPALPPDAARAATA